MKEQVLRGNSSVNIWNTDSKRNTFVIINTQKIQINSYKHDFFFTTQSDEPIRVDGYLLIIRTWKRVASSNDIKYLWSSLV